MENTPAHNVSQANSSKILVLDHIPELRRGIAEVLIRKGYQVEQASDGQDALDKLDQERYKILIANATTGQVTGVDIIPFAKRRWPHLEIIVMSNSISLDSALEAIQYQVYEVLELPVDISRLERSVRNAIEHARMLGEREKLLLELDRQNELLEKQVRTVTKELREKSIRDELTGLYNYRHFLKALERELSRVQRYQRTMSLAMLDLDHFKKLNDNLGHQQGNQVLVQVSEVLKDGCRASDIPVRYGGEEFAIILPETSKKAARGIVDRIRLEVQNLKVSYQNDANENCFVTISAGIAAAPEDATSSEHLIRKADSALYAAKASGRNCLCLSS